MKSENEIPKFDLADQIMAGHRKFTAVKRIAPKKKDHRQKTTDIRPQTKDQEIQTSLKSDVSGLMSDASSQQIISEIVARDIQNFRSR
jgi:hypothetical protein